MQTPASRGPPCFGAGAGQEENASLIASRLIIVSRCWLSHSHRGAGSPRGRAALGGSGVRERCWGLCPDVPRCPPVSPWSHEGQRVVLAHSCSAAGQGASYPRGFSQQGAKRRLHPLLPPPAHLLLLDLHLLPKSPSPRAYPQASSVLPRAPRASPASPPSLPLPWATLRLTSPLSLGAAGMREEHSCALRGQIKALYLSSR